MLEFIFIPQSMFFIVVCFLISQSSVALLLAITRSSSQSTYPNYASYSQRTDFHGSDSQYCFDDSALAE